MSWLRAWLVPVCIVASHCGAQSTGALPAPLPTISVAPPSGPLPADGPMMLKPLGGTLFFDEIERDRMDRARKPGSSGIDPPIAKVEPSIVNGFVKRSDGITTVWVDGAYQQVTSTTLVARISSSAVGMSVSIADSTKSTASTSSKKQTPAKVSKKTQHTKRKNKSHNSISRE